MRAPILISYYSYSNRVTYICVKYTYIVIVYTVMHGIGIFPLNLNLVKKFKYR